MDVVNVALTMQPFHTALWNWVVRTNVVPHRGCATRHGAARAGKEVGTMQQNKDLRALNAQLHALLARNDVGPEQKKQVEAALEELRRLRHKQRPSQADVCFCVRKVAESLLNAFQKN